jgi:hypothetical protein
MYNLIDLSPMVFELQIDELLRHFLLFQKLLYLRDSSVGHKSVYIFSNTFLQKDFPCDKKSELMSNCFVYNTYATP